MILDPQADGSDLQQIAEKIRQTEPDLLGLSAHTEEINDAAEIAEAVKESRPETATVIGGYHVSALPSETLAEFGSFDLGVVGEDEFPLLAIAEGKAPRETQGIVFRDDHGKIVRNETGDELPSLANLPLPAWDLFDLRAYGNLLPVEMVRACPFSCPFCFKGATGRRVRYKPPERVLDEIGHLVRVHGVREFFFASSGTFPVDRDHAIAVCKGIIERGSRIRWFTGTRVDLVDEELLTLMKQAGCFGINFGIESGDPDVLEHCRKGITLDLAERAVKLCHGLGLETELGFILGLPGETRQSLENTRRFAARLRPYSTLANFAILTPFPGTQVYDMALRNQGGLRIKTTDWRAYSKQAGEALLHDNFAEGELKRYQAKMYLSYYFGSPRKLVSSLFSHTASGLRDPRRVLSLLKNLFA